jgi:protein tyrosine phosphatase (PTP) superfamily phosphohydrolase (DUF442 family)
MPNTKAACGIRRRLVRRWALGIGVVALAALFVPEIVRVTLGANFHAVIDGRFYRAAQPSGPSLANAIRAYGIRTVVNLRGPNNDGEDWYEEEKQVAARTGIQFVSVNMSASDKPQEAELRKLIDTFDQCPVPILVHCNSGSDRSGFASACFLLMTPGAGLDEARAQLSIRYGHFPWGRAGCLSQVLDQYQKWLDGQGLSHEPGRFRRWAREIYQKDDWPEP